PRLRFSREAIRVSSAVSFARMVRVLSLAIPCLLPLLSGCDLESYPTDLTYPLRSDPIVTSPPGSTRWDTTAPGQLEHHIPHLSDPDIGGKTLDPGKLGGKQPQQIEKILHDVFGTPAEPLVYLKGAEEDVNNYIKDLHLDKDTLKLGSRVYRRHC